MYFTNCNDELKKDANIIKDQINECVISKSGGVLWNCTGLDFITK